jgi:hypothetical protein
MQIFGSRLLIAIQSSRVFATIRACSAKTSAAAAMASGDTAQPPADNRLSPGRRASCAPLLQIHTPVGSSGPQRDSPPAGRGHVSRGEAPAAAPAVARASSTVATDGEAGSTELAEATPVPRTVLARAGDVRSSSQTSMMPLPSNLVANLWILIVTRVICLDF